jgi:hypothetical protein
MGNLQVFLQFFDTGLLHHIQFLFGKRIEHTLLKIVVFKSWDNG